MVNHFLQLHPASLARREPCALPLAHERNAPNDGRASSWGKRIVIVPTAEDSFREYLSLPCRTAKVFPRTGRGKTSREKRNPSSENYGVGEEVVVVVDSVVLEVPEVGAGVAVEVVFVVLVVLVVVSVEVPPAGDGFTIVVLVSPGEAAGATVSVFCSHAAKSAALARMQIYFFISCGLKAHIGANHGSEQGKFSVVPQSIFDLASRKRRSLERGFVL